jgi:hypothetical protein
MTFASARRRVGDMARDKSAGFRRSYRVRLGGRAAHKMPSQIASLSSASASTTVSRYSVVQSGATANDPEELILLRQCADEAGLPHVCPETACAKARRCRARRRPVAHRPHFSYPPCLATVWEDIYAPYARYRAYCSWLVDLDAKLRAGAGDGGQERSTPDGRLKR